MEMTAVNRKMVQTGVSIELNRNLPRQSNNVDLLKFTFCGEDIGNLHHSHSMPEESTAVPNSNHPSRKFNFADKV